MKDARGHGSNKRGMASAATAGNHQAGVLGVGKPYHVQALATERAGPPWETVKRVGNRAVAERIAQLMRVDRRGELMRVQTGPARVPAAVKAPAADKAAEPKQGRSSYKSDAAAFLRGRS